MRHLLGITKLDKEKNQCIREKTGAQNIVKEIKQYQKKWLKHVQRMGTHRIPKQAWYRPKGRRNIGWPKKRWRDQLHFEGQGTGNTPNPSGTWWWKTFVLSCISWYKIYPVLLYFNVCLTMTQSFDTRGSVPLQQSIKRLSSTKTVNTHVCV